MKVRCAVILFAGLLGCRGAEPAASSPPDFIRLFENRQTRDELTNVYQLPVAKVVEATKKVDGYKTVLEATRGSSGPNQAPALRREANAQIQTIFTPPQLEVLQRALWRSQGADALLSPKLDVKLAEKLGVTPRQRAQLAEAAGELEAERRVILDSLPRGTPEFVRQQQAPFRENQQKKLQSILTTEQQKQWEELNAPPH